MNSYFDDGVYDELVNRLNKLNENSKANWGKMTVSQMLYHCQMPLNIILGKEDYGLKPSWFFKLFFKKSFYSDKPWSKNLPTAPGFKITDDKDFEEEKNGLSKLMEELNSQRNKSEWRDHPSLGKFTKTQWGKTQYKHLDHHFRQFGV